MPHKAAVYRISFAMLPLAFGGVHKTMFLHPAKVAGTPNIKTVENKGAVPAWNIQSNRFNGPFFLPNSEHLAGFRRQLLLFFEQRETFQYSILLVEWLLLNRLTRVPMLVEFLLEKQK